MSFAEYFLRRDKSPFKPKSSEPSVELYEESVISRNDSVNAKEEIKRIVKKKEPLRDVLEPVQPQNEDTLPPEPAASELEASSSSWMSYIPRPDLFSYIYGTSVTNDDISIRSEPAPSSVTAHKPTRSVSQPAKPKINPDILLPPWSDDDVTVGVSRITRLIGGLLKKRQEVGASSRFVVIGVHGWFPSKLVEKFVGEPTATSLKFTMQLTRALKNHVEKNYNYVLLENQVFTIPLQCGGTVRERLQILYNSLTLATNNHIHYIQQATHVIIITHSQGTPVSTLLLHKLFTSNIVNFEQTVGIIAMAGISHGPIYTLKENYVVRYIERQESRELFEFCNPESEISQQFHEAMEFLVNNGVKVCTIASWFDQVVPLYSALMHGFDHRNIHRCVFVDGDNYSSDFLTHLISFALRIRNRGKSDYNLIMHLTDTLLGSLYSSQGHSTLYESLQVYERGIKFVLSPSIPTHKFTQKPLNAWEELNPFFLPWIWKSIECDSAVQADIVLQTEIERIKEEYRKWEPDVSGLNGKALKELKYRMEMLKTKL